MGLRKLRSDRAVSANDRAVSANSFLRYFIAQIWSRPPLPVASVRTRARTPARPSQHSGLRRWCPRPSAWSTEERRTSCRPFARDPLTVGPLCAETRQDSWTVRAFLSGSFGSSLSRILSELAIRCLYGDLASRVTIVMPCESALIPVPSAAPRARRLSGREWRPRATVPTESIGDLRSAIMGIGTDIADAISAVSEPPAV